MLLRKSLWFAALALLGSSPAKAADLPRQAALGVRLAPAPGGGVMVQDVAPGQTGAALGLRPGDIIVRAGQQVVAGPQSIGAYIRSVGAGEPARLTVRRGEETTTLTAAATARPLERYAGARVDYGAVPFRDGALRDILVMPENGDGAPVVFLMQGFTCASIESPDPQDTYRQLAAHLSRRGIGFYRVEKPQVGDSRGGPNCTEIDFQVELDGFRAAYRHLIETRRIPPERIFLLGHSLGGLQAPLLASERAPRGVAVYGTVLRNWADYHQEAASIQGFIYSGKDPAQEISEGERAREVTRRYFLEGQSPTAIVAARPELEPVVRSVLGWQGGDNGYAGRHVRFLQSLANLPLVPAWRDARSHVLALYGENDLVALFDTDHRLIADIVNHYRPGTARFVQVPGTDHDMRLLGVDRLGFRRHVAANAAPPQGSFNEAVAQTLAEWIGEVMRAPPIASR
jgi:hypothetical protein